MRMARGMAVTTGVHEGTPIASAAPRMLLCRGVGSRQQVVKVPWPIFGFEGAGGLGEV